MGHRMRRLLALVVILGYCREAISFIPGADGPVSQQEALEGGKTTLLCDSTTAAPGDELMLLVWYRDNAPVYSYDFRVHSEWSHDSFNTSGRLSVNLTIQPTQLTLGVLTDEDQALYHCRVDFLLTQTRNIGVNLTVVVLPSKPFFLDEVGNKVETKIGPYHDGDTLVLSCLVIGGRPPPRITWYSGGTLVDDSDGESDIPGVRENELYLPLGRDHAGPLTCRASNTKLSGPVSSQLEIDLYLPPYNVTILWPNLASSNLSAGRPVVAQCVAKGSRPPPDLAWWLDHKHLTLYSNQSYSAATNTAVSYVELTPGVADDGATLSCVATNAAMVPSRGSKADVITLNVTYSPIVEVGRAGGGGGGGTLPELAALRLQCEVRANPPVHRISWYFNDMLIEPGPVWGTIEASLASLVILEVTRNLTGWYSCAASNAVGETRANSVNVTVLYPPECTASGIALNQEKITCNVDSLPTPDTFFWHIKPAGLEMQQLTTGSPLLPLSQINGPLAGLLHVTCEAGNGVASQERPCDANLSLEHLRPPQPAQCDLAFELKEFQMRCIPVENATYYELTVWRMSSSNTSLILERRATMGWGTGGHSARGQAPGGEVPWLVRGALGRLRGGDEAGASACNRYGCSPALLLRPTETLLYAASPPWWHFLLEKDMGIALGGVVLICLFVATSVLAARAARRGRKPTMQVLRLDDVTREYIDNAIEVKRHASRSLRSCSSGYSGGSLDSALPEPSGPPPVERHRKPVYYWDPGPPPDVTLTLHRESAV